MKTMVRNLRPRASNTLSFSLGVPVMGAKKALIAWLVMRSTRMVNTLLSHSSELVTIADSTA